MAAVDGRHERGPVTAGFDALFDTFTHSAYRLETLPAYGVPQEDESFRAFLHGEPRPERSVRTSPWMRRIALTTAAGKQWSRTRVLDTPLTDYQRYQLPAYLESQAVGEQIRITPRFTSVDTPDFWLFDDETDQPWAIVLDYSDRGEFTGHRVVRHPSVIKALRMRRHAYDSRSIPLAEYLTLAGGGRG
jgi:hypothetical protein